MADMKNDTVDTSILSFFKSSSEKGKVEVTATKKPSVKVLKIDAENYKMNHSRRGQAIIFNHMKFKANANRDLNDRRGTDVDRDILEEVLENLGFEVKVHEDLKTKDIKRVLEKAADADHTDEDCIFVAVLSHGEEGILYSSDNQYKPEVLWENFKPDRCPSLAGKPKIILMQACQGDKKDDGVDAKFMTETDAVVESNTFKIPAMADFLFAYSTIPGYFSWRNTKNGTWYVQALGQVLTEDGLKPSNLDLLSLLTKVARKVALEFQSNVPSDINWHEKKQIPCFTSMLTRNLIFNPREKAE